LISTGNNVFVDAQVAATILTGGPVDIDAGAGVLDVIDHGAGRSHLSMFTYNRFGELAASGRTAHDRRSRREWRLDHSVPRHGRVIPWTGIGLRLNDSSFTIRGPNTSLIRKCKRPPGDEGVFLAMLRVVPSLLSSSLR
jgi:hypothetical protein